MSASNSRMSMDFLNAMTYFSRLIRLKSLGRGFVPLPHFGASGGAGSITLAPQVMPRFSCLHLPSSHFIIAQPQILHLPVFTSGVIEFPLDLVVRLLWPDLNRLRLLKRISFRIGRQTYSCTCVSPSTPQSNQDLTSLLPWPVDSSIASTPCRDQARYP